MFLPLVVFVVDCKVDCEFDSDWINIVLSSFKGLIMKWTVLVSSLDNW